MVQTIVNDTLQFGNNEAENRYKSIDNANRAMKADTSLMNNTERSDFMQEKEGENIGLLNAVSDSVATGNIAEAASINEAITDTNDIETNLKTVNDIVLSWNQGNVHTATDSTTLDYISMQDPATGGKGVYQARAALRKRIIDRGFYISQLRMANTNTATNSESKQEEVLIFPNPTTGIVYIQLLLPRNLISQIKVVDIMSREISVFEAKSEMIKLDLNSLVAGSYTLKIKVETGKEYRKQIVLTK